MVAKVHFAPTLLPIVQGTSKACTLAVGLILINGTNGMTHLAILVF